jgi:tRNA (guanine-N7-)-methyltransferase
MGEPGAEGRILYRISEEIPPETREEARAYFANIFSGDRPLIVEIGSGNGHFLVEQAMTHPELNFAGTEILGGRARKFSSKIEKRSLTNIVVFKGDARRFIWEFMYREMVREFVVMFPDPWPKKRHHKHRLLKEAFVRMLHYRLESGGIVSVVTDHRGYRNFVMEEFRKAGGFTPLITGGFSSYPEENPVSLFEKKFREWNREIFHMQYRRE